MSLGCDSVFGKEHTLSWKAGLVTLVPWLYGSSKSLFLEISREVEQDVSSMCNWILAGGLSLNLVLYKVWDFNNIFTSM